MENIIIFSCDRRVPLGDCKDLVTVDDWIGSRFFVVDDFSIQAGYGLMSFDDFLAVLGQAQSYILVTARSSGILKAKQKLGVTFNFAKQDVIDFTKGAAFLLVS